MNDAARTASQRASHEAVIAAARTFNNVIASAALQGVEIKVTRQTRPSVGDLPPCPQVVIEPFTEWSAAS